MKIDHLIEIWHGINSLYQQHEVLILSRRQVYLSLKLCINYIEVGLKGKFQLSVIRKRERESKIYFWPAWPKCGHDMAVISKIKVHTSFNVVLCVTGPWISIYFVIEANRTFFQAKSTQNFTFYIGYMDIAWIYIIAPPFLLFYNFSSNFFQLNFACTPTHEL